MVPSFRHLTSAAQLTREDVDRIIAVADEMATVLERGGDDRLRGKLLASLFYEPSTRTRLSFETAMQRLGGHVITADGLQFSSLYKGESLEDSIRVIGQYADIVCMRHPEEGSAARAASVCPVPFINAGDGAGEHPTQALLDVVTLHKECGRLSGLHVAMVGDLKYGRAARSLAILLTLYSGIRFTFVSPPSLKMLPSVTKLLKEKGAAYEETGDLKAALAADAVYMTRVQKERFTDPKEYERLKDSYILTAKHVQGKPVKVLHPLPRVTEISTDVDSLPNAAYFRQAANGLLTRMALLSLMLGKA